MSMKTPNNLISGVEQAVTDASVDSECGIFRNRGYNKPQASAKALVN